jgi:hypothetical protein
MSIILTIVVLIFLFYINDYREKEQLKEQLDAKWVKIEHACLHAKLTPEVISEVKKRLYNNDEDYLPYLNWQVIKQSCITAGVRPDVIEEIKNTFKKWNKDKRNGVPYCRTNEQFEEYYKKRIECDLRNQYEDVRLKNIRELDEGINKNLGIKLGDRPIFLD